MQLAWYFLQAVLWNSLFYLNQKSCDIRQLKSKVMMKIINELYKYFSKPVIPWICWPNLKTSQPNITLYSRYFQLWYIFPYCCINERQICSYLRCLLCKYVSFTIDLSKTRMDYIFKTQFWTKNCTLENCARMCSLSSRIRTSWQWQIFSWSWPYCHFLLYEALPHSTP